MSGTMNIDELDQRIAVARDNIRQLIEQGAATLGAADEVRAADRIAQQDAVLADLLVQRDAAAN